MSAAGANYRAIIPTGPIDKSPTGFLPAATQEELLRDVLRGVDLGVYDDRIVKWLAGWDASTVLTVASLIYRARAAERSKL